uniref:C3H1-type domain-containing protein n=1 Tax=Brassica oleracea TaxID=3712 RepID=A0A3P6DXV1_BRAOL|nr:unnamed protein product [Brassica oleracea]
MRHELGQSSEYPVRTGAGDCQYYLNGGCFFGRSCRYNHPPRNQMGDDTVQPTAYKVRLGATNCEQYLHTGQCSYGSRCWFNHPPLPGARDCGQYLQTGQCSYGRRCRFNHSPTHLAPVRKKDRGCKPGSSIQYTNSMRGDGIEPMRQATTWGRRSDERRHETESTSRAEKRARTIPDYPSVIQDVSDEVGAGQNSWLQRRRAQENVQSGKIDCGQRRVSEEERTLRETVPCSVLVLYSQERQAYDLEEQKQRERVDENLRIDQIKATVQSDGGIQTEQRLEVETRLFFTVITRRKIPENLQEQAEMEREKREAQKKERIRSLTDNVDQLIQSLQDNIGIRRKKGDGA